MIQAIIPARGGSKGVPRKNTLPLGGKPLIAWTIEAAKKSILIDEVFVSTEDSEISDIAKKCGASVICRPRSISGDFASSEEALLHAISVNEKCARSEIIVFLQCTAPLTAPEDIDSTIQVLLDEQADTAVAVTDFRHFLWHNDETTFVGLNHDESVRELRQARKPNYLETGAVYVARREGFEKHRHRFFGKIVHYVTPADRVWEIDSLVDFQVAEVLLRNSKKAEAVSKLPTDIRLCVFEFEGVFTNNQVGISQDGDESVTCSRSDGLAIGIARKAGLPMLILSSDANQVVKKRAAELGIDVIHGTSEKEQVLESILEERMIQWDNVIYVGHDINDLGCLQRAGCSVVVADAHDAVRTSADIILDHEGGDGAVREAIELVMNNGIG